MTTRPTHWAAHVAMLDTPSLAAARAMADVYVVQAAPISGART